MQITNRFPMRAILVVTALAFGPTVALAQNASSQPQSADDHSTHHPGTGPDETLSGSDYGPMMGAWGMGPQGMMGYGGMGQWMMAGRGSGQAMCTAMVGHVDGRLAYLKTELKITQAQEPLWAAYASAARDSANAMLAHCTTMMGQRSATSLNLPDRLDQHEQLMAAQLEALRAKNKALKPLYGSFSDEQKKAADQLFWGPMGMM